MNPLSGEILERANREAIYNIYLYLAHKTLPDEGETLSSIVSELDALLKNQGAEVWSEREIYRLRILRNAVERDSTLAGAAIGDLIRLQGGMTACSFTEPGGAVSVVFRGSGGGEWIDNGEGLSGIPEANTYITYGRGGGVVSRETVQMDYASDQQVGALNWFHGIAAKNGWDAGTPITVSGHSKGGNKAQFAAVCSDLAVECYSFDGQGFSPEALAAFEERYGAEFEERRARIRSFSADNDYVNVLGKRLCPEEGVFFFESAMGFHHMESILDSAGRLRPQCEQGRLSRYAERISDDLMEMKPSLRRHAVLGIMNLFQIYLGEGTPVNGDAVSIEQTLAGIGIAIGPVLRQLRGG